MLIYSDDSMILHEKSDKKTYQNDDSDLQQQNFLMKHYITLK